MKKLTISLLISFCFFSNIKAQTNGYGQKSDSAATKLSRYVLNNLQEKVYLVTDKPYYTLGDTLWFQSYLVNALSHEPLTLSNTIYVELASSDGEVLKDLVLLADSGLAPGDFVIGEKWSPGKYMLRAYTKWMLNFPESYLFQKEFDVFDVWPQDYKHNEDDSPVVASTEDFENSGVNTKPSVELRFFPEGGNMVPGFPAMLGVKAVLSGTDTGVKVKGKVLKAETGDQLATFECNQYGVGGFYLPASDTEVTVQLDSPGFELKYEFPKAKAQSYGLKVINRFQGKSIPVMIETDIPGGLDGGFLIGHTRGQAFAVLAMHGLGTVPRKILSIDSKQIPTGVAHFTFFDRDGVPRAERLAYIDHQDKVLPAEILTGRTSFKKRGRVDLGLQLADTLNGNVSLSVTNSKVIVRDPDGENLASYLFLNSDLSGQVKRPSYYLKDMNKERFQELDYLMLTHGWRRFVWEDVLSEEDVSFPIKPEAGITLSGQIKNQMFENKVETGVVQLTCMPQSAKSVLIGFSMDEQETDDQGRFFFNNIHYWDSVKFIIQARKSADKINTRFLIELDEANAPKLSPFGGTPVLGPDLANALMAKRNKQYVIDKSYGEQVIMLDEIAVEARSKNNITEVVGGRYANPDFRLIADSLRGPKAYLIDILRMVPAIQISPSGGLTIRSKSPTVYLDGFEIEGPMINDVIQGTSGNEIYFVDVDKSGLSTTKGLPVLYIYTKSGSGIATSKKIAIPGVLKFFHPGYYKAREFYAPNYAPSLPKTAKPDYRLQLYWQPKVRIENGKAEVSFYVGDDQEAFDVVVEGMTLSGEVISSTGKIRVE